MSKLYHSIIKKHTEEFRKTFLETISILQRFDVINNDESDEKGTKDFVTQVVSRDTTLWELWNLRKQRDPVRVLPSWHYFVLLSV